MDVNTMPLHLLSAADLYIKEFLHDYVETDDHAEARPLRVMYKFRWIQTVPEVVLEYTLLEREGPMAGTFRPPTVDDVMKHRVIIATLSSARYLVDLDLPKGSIFKFYLMWLPLRIRLYSIYKEYFLKKVNLTK